MSQITIGGTTLNFKDSAFTGDQWEQVASWVLNGGAEGIDANAQIAREKAAAASASAAAARNSATSAGESATAAANSATAAKASEDAAAGSATNAAASATSAGKSASAASERASNATNSASVASSKANDAIAAASDAQDAKNKAANSQAAAKQSEDNAAASATNAGKSASSAANSAASASSSATAAANSATAAKASEDAAAGSAANAAASATSAANSAANASDSATAAATSAQTAQSAASTATGAASMASTAAEKASGSASQAQASAADAANSAASVDGINKTAQSWAVGGTGTREGEDTNNAKYWAEHAKEVAGGDFATKSDLAAKPSMVIAEIPKGRMRGDVDGDGEITQNDVILVRGHASSDITLMGADLWCADINGDGSVDMGDMTFLSRYLNGYPTILTVTPTFADYYNNWTYHKVDDTSGYWTAELSIPAVTAETEGSITWGGTGFTGTFIKAEAFSGGVRIYANYPPIEALPCAVSYHTGAGGQFIIANTGVSEIGAKYVIVKLTKSGWSEEKKQTISVPGLKEDVLKQLIIPTQPSTDIEKYYSAGIRISARGDNTLTFSCDTIPTANIEVVLVIIPIIGKFEG